MVFLISKINIGAGKVLISSYLNIKTEKFRSNRSNSICEYDKIKNNKNQNKFFIISI